MSARSRIDRSWLAERDEIEERQRPDAILVRAELRTRLRRMLDARPERERLAIEMRFADVSYVDIGQVLGMPTYRAQLLAEQAVWPLQEPHRARCLLAFLDNEDLERIQREVPTLREVAT